MERQEPSSMAHYWYQEEIKKDPRLLENQVSLMHTGTLSEKDPLELTLDDFIEAYRNEVTAGKAVVSESMEYKIQNDFYNSWPKVAMSES
jgi:hypothetical protein